MKVMSTSADSINDTTNKLSNLSISGQRRIISKGIGENGFGKCGGKIFAGNSLNQNSPDFVSDPRDPSHRKLPIRNVNQPPVKYPTSEPIYLIFPNPPSASSLCSDSQTSFHSGDRCRSVDSSQLLSSPDSTLLKNGSTSSDDDVNDFTKSDDDELFGTNDLTRLSKGTLTKELPQLPVDWVEGVLNGMKNDQKPQNTQTQFLQPTMLSTHSNNHFGQIHFGVHPAPIVRNMPLTCASVPIDPSLLSSPQFAPAPPPYCAITRPVQPNINQFVGVPQAIPAATSQRNEVREKRGRGRPRSSPVKKPDAPRSIKPSTSIHVDEKSFDVALRKFSQLSKTAFMKSYEGKMSIFHKVALEEPFNFPALCQVYIMKKLVRETSFSLTQFTDALNRTILFLLVEKKQLMNIKVLFQIANQDCTIRGQKTGQPGITSVFHMAVLYTGNDAKILSELISNVEKRLPSHGKRPQEEVLFLLDSENRTPLKYLLEAINNASNNEEHLNSLIENLKLLLQFGQNIRIATKDFNEKVHHDALSFAASISAAPRLLPLLVNSLPSKKLSQSLNKKYGLNQCMQAKCLVDIIEDNSQINPLEKSNLIDFLREKGATSAYESVDLDEYSNDDCLSWLFDDNDF